MVWGLPVLFVQDGALEFDSVAVQELRSQRNLYRNTWLTFIK